MILIFISDLHVGHTSKKEAVALAEKVIAKLGGEEAYVVLGGDVGEKIQHFDQALNIFSECFSQVGVLVGNHDLYAYGEVVSSNELYRKTLPALASKHGCHWMEDGPVPLLAAGGRHTEAIIVGTPGWCDGRFKATGVPFSDDEVRRSYYSYMADATHIDLSYLDLAEEQAARFRSNVRHADTMASISMTEKGGSPPIIVCSHYPLYWDAWTPGPTGRPVPSDAFFMGSKALDEFCRQHSFPIAVSGHIHKGYMKLSGNERETLVISSPSGYGNPAAVLINLSTLSVDEDPDVEIVKLYEDRSAR